MGRRPRGKAHDPTQFIYVDVSHSKPKAADGKVHSKWVRIKLDDVESYKQAHSNFNVFSTIQRFINPAHTDPELTYMPLYFDLDSDRSLLELLKLEFITLDDVVPHLDSASAAAISNFVKMGVGFEDAKNKDSDDFRFAQEIEAQVPKEILWHANLSISKSDATKLRDFFATELGVTGHDFRVFFSGKKGFHCLVSAEVLGVEPRTDLNHVYRYIALYLMERLHLQALDYGSIYSSRRMLRMSGSIHQSTKLFKTELRAEELEWVVGAVIEVAKTPRKELYADVNADEITTSEAAVTWYNYMTGKYEETAKARHELIIHSDTLSQMTDMPVCVQDMMGSGIKKSGDRNKATMALSSYFKDIGTSMDETANLLVTQWLPKVPSEYTSTHGREAEIGTRTAIKTVYDNDKYHFGCAFIRSLHGERRPGSKDYDAVSCAGRKCPLHEDHRKDKDEAIPVHLSDSGNSEYAMKKVGTSVLVSGKLDTPYLVAKRVKYVCYNEDCQKACVLRDNGFILEKEFAASDRILIEAAHQQDNNLKGIIKAHGGAACPKHTYEILEYANVEEILVVPMAERVSDLAENDSGDIHSTGKIVDEAGKEFVARKVYYVRGDDTDKIMPNSHYYMEGFVYPHPKNQQATILSQVARPLHDSIDKFRVTDDNKELARVFQLKPGETMSQRIDIILEDITQNVTRIYERYEPLLALLWTYHSAINFYFQEELVQRGWLELVMVGDTGQAKTKMTTRLMNYIGLGAAVGGETASRTGILYTLDQVGERWFITWGEYPLNDRRLLAIDEFSGLSDDDFSQMTEARSTGLLKITRKVKVETNTRVRLVLMSNPRWGKQLHKFQYGIESLTQLFKEASDIRRLDLAVFLATKDIKDDVINREYERPKERLISSDAIKYNVLWAWSRKPDQIIIAKKVERLILKRATELSDKYGSAKDIPIVIPEEERIKLARLAVANAMLRHSTDETGELVIVEEADVEFVFATVQHIFDAKNCRYDIYARNAREEGELTEDEKEKLTTDLQDLDFDDHAPISKDILELFRRNDTMKPTELRDMTGFDTSHVNARIAILAKYGMIKKTKNGMQVLPKFLDYLDQTRAAD